VDHHVHKDGHPVDGAGKMIYELWIRWRTRLSRAPARAVENRAAMWTRATENRWKKDTGPGCRPEWVDGTLGRF